MSGTDIPPRRMISIPVRTLYEHNREDLKLEILAGFNGLDRNITAPRIQKPGLALAGYLDQLQSETVQILGRTEFSYLGTLDRELSEKRFEQLCSSDISCIVITNDLEPPPAILASCDRYNLTLFRTSEISSSLIRQVTTYLEDILSPETSIHGCLVDVYGVGILIIGKSGIGKSECALGLIERGHRLVGDDLVVIRKKVPGVLFGRATELIKHHMEIRGLGIINIKDLFGVSSIRQNKKIELVAELVGWHKDQEVERLGLDEHTYAILDVEIPHLRVQVRPGRDLTLILEVAARNHLLKRMGYHAAKEFERAFSERMSRKQPEQVKPDPESVE
jgi:HPr kinase/phosphorylase